MREIVTLAKQILKNPSQRDQLLHQFIENHQFPIVDSQFATFFYWNPDPVDSVHLLHWVHGLESRQELRRLPGTNAFWLTLELPRKARIEYKYEIHKNGGRYWSRDPHNAMQAFDPFGSNSVCAMDGYQEPKWAFPQSNIREGTIESFKIYSKAFTEERTVTMYLPHEYKSHKKYPLLICHDGSDYRRYASMIHVLNNLIQQHDVLPILVAFVDGHHRNVEYAANPQQAAFLVEDVLPAVEERYRVAQGSENRAVMGASFGAVSSLFTSWRYPGVFDKLLLQSGSFAFTDIGDHGRGELWDPIVEFVNALRENPGVMKGKMYISCGVFESLIYYNRTLAPLFQQHGVDVRYVESRDGHNWINWRDRLREGLTWLFPGHLRMYYE